MGVSEAATEFKVSEQTICALRRRARIDAGLETGVSQGNTAEANGFIGISEGGLFQGN